MKIDRRQLSKTISHALRHAPHLYELELDDEGWTSADELLGALRHHKRAWGGLELADLEAVVETNSKKRFELVDGRIRALYGHSLPGKLLKTPGEPPEVLYHGTDPEIAALIRRDGLRAMSRQYVHLSVDTGTALEVGRRKDDAPVLLTIRAREAYAAGHPFYAGNHLVWLADDGIPPAFIDG